MKIFVKPIVGKLIVLDVDPNSTIETLKQKIESKSGILKTQQRLIYHGIPLLEGVLKTYNILENSTIDLVMCLG